MHTRLYFLEKHSEADILECVWAVLTWCCPVSSAVAQELDLESSCFDAGRLGETLNSLYLSLLVII